MTEDLPDGWHNYPLKDLASDIAYGYTAKAMSKHGGAKMLRITDIQNERVDWSSVPTCEILATEISRYRLRDGDLVFARTGATVGKSFLICGEIPESVFASYLIRVQPALPAMSKYLAYFFKSPLYWTQISELSVGTGQPNVNGSKLKGLIVPVAPLNEQQRISNKLDDLLGRVNDCRDRIKKIGEFFPAQFRNTVLRHAFRGDLSRGLQSLGSCPSQDKIAEIRASRLPSIRQDFYAALIPTDLEGLGQLPSHWRWDKAGNICQSIVPNRDKPRSFNGSISWVTTPQLSDSRISIDFSTSKDGLNEEEIATYNARVVPAQSVIMTCVGSLGVAAVTEQPCVINQQLHAFVCHDLINPIYLAYALKFQKSWLERNATSTTVRYLNKTNCNSVPIPLCSKDEQEIIANRINLLFAMCQRIELTLEMLEIRLNRLRMAILRAAFRGELMPQDPNDEPAQALVSKIQRKMEVADVKGQTESSKTKQLPIK